MDILNFISWIRGGRQVTTVDPSKTLLPVGLKDGRRDDQYLAGAISVQDFLNLVPEFELKGLSYIVVLAKGPTASDNAAELQAAYVTAQGMSPSVTNRITVIAAPGNYDFGSTPFVMDAEYIDLVSLDGNRSIVFNSANSGGTISITANDVFVYGVDVVNKEFTIANNLNLLRVTNCKGGDFSFGGSVGILIEVSGTFIDCIAGSNSFSCNVVNYTGTASGTFINCAAGARSFLGASGTFTNCTGGLGAFGGDGIASGTFTKCTAGNNSFGGSAFITGIASGTFIDCTAGSTSFGGGTGSASGIFKNCTAGDASFAAGGTASGTFINCVGGNSQFGNGCFGGGFTGVASGTFNNCTSGGSAFGGGAGLASGIFTNCTGDDFSFGVFGTLTGKLYYCRLTSGTFETVSGAGITRLCIDGNNVENNQG